MTRRDKNFLICIRILKINFGTHIKVWGDEIKYRDGFLAPWLKGCLTSCFNKASAMEDKYITKEADECIKESDLDKTIKEITDFNLIQKNRKALGGDRVSFSVEEEMKTVPDPKLIDSFVSFGITLEYIEGMHKITMERMGALEEFKKLLVQANKYIKWFEKRVIITAKKM